MKKIPTKTMRGFLQFITGFTGLCLIAFEINLFASNINQLFTKLGLVFLLSILFMLISHFIFSLFITVSKYVYCLYKKYDLQTIAIFPFIINIKPKKICIGKLKYFFLNDVTNLQYTLFSKSNCIKEDFIEIEFKFNKTSRYIALMFVFIIALLFCLNQKYSLAFILIGSSFGAMLVDKENDYYNGIDNTISNQVNDLNILRFALKHVCIENFDKSVLYADVFTIYPKDNWSFFYFHDLIIESIVDSILDHKAYIQPHEYVNYLRGNMPMIDEQRPDTIKILRYFYIYNLINDNSDGMNEILEDILYQKEFIKYNDFFKKMKFTLVDRWIQEIYTCKFSFTDDDKYATLNYSYVYQEKRRKLEALINYI